MVKVHLSNGQTILVPNAGKAKVHVYGMSSSNLDSAVLQCKQEDAVVAEFKLGQVVGYSVEP